MRLSYHSGQLKIFRQAKQDRARFFSVQAGRRFGKSRGGRTKAIEKLLRDWRGIYDPESRPCLIIIMPEQKRAKALHWKSLVNMFENWPGTARIDKTDLRIEFRKIQYPDGVVRQPPDIILAGAQDGGEKVRGNRLWGALLDEYQDFPPTMWREVVRPALADTPGSWAILIGTPKGKASPLAKLRRDYADVEGWGHYHGMTVDNPFVPRLEIETARRELPPRDFRQEFEASEEDFPGRIYDAFDPDKHLVDSAPSDCSHAFLGFDAGDVNPAVVVHVAKRFDAKWRFWCVAADHMGDGENAVPDAAQDERVAELCDRHNVLRVFAPPERAGRILQFRSYGREHNIQGMQKCIKADNSVSDGNGYINSLFYQDRLFLTADCSRQSHDLTFPDELSSYHRKQDKKTELFLDKPEDGQIDHRCDAQRYNLFTLKMREMVLG